MPPPDGRQPDRPDETGTWLVIPYFDEDLGRPGAERPISPSRAVPWLCSSIIVDGVRGGTSFRRGVPIRVAVEVANWGAGALPAVALVRLWWSDPTLAFASATLFAQTAIPVPPTGEPVRAGEFTVTIPVGVSPHICLLAQVSAPLDGASGVPNPDGDRHWAQLNLLESAADADGAYPIQFILANPFPYAAQSRVDAGQMPPTALRFLSAQLGLSVKPSERAVIEMEGGPVVELAPQSTKNVSARLRIAGLPGPNDRHGVTLTQRVWRDGEDVERALTGSLGILLKRS